MRSPFLKRVLCNKRIRLGYPGDIKRRKEKQNATNYHAFKLITYHAKSKLRLVHRNFLYDLFNLKTADNYFVHSSHAVYTSDTCYFHYLNSFISSQSLQQGHICDGAGVDS